LDVEELSICLVFWVKLEQARLETSRIDASGRQILAPDN